MRKIDTLIKLFFDKFEETKCEEKFRILDRNVIHNELKIPDRDLLVDQLDKFPKRDQVSIFVFVDPTNHAALIWNNNNEKYPDLKTKRSRITRFFTRIKDLLTTEDEEDEEDEEPKEDEEEKEESGFRIMITINKRIDDDNRISIYSLKHIFEFLSQLTLLGLYFAFRQIFPDKGYIAAVFQEDFKEAPFHTCSFYFVPKNYNGAFSCFKKKERDELFNNRNEVANFLNAVRYPFIPQDFILEQRSNNDKFNLMMDKLAIICSLTYLCNISSLEDKQYLKCHLMGYKKVEQMIDFNQLEFVKESKSKYCLEYVEIYKWVYSGGDLSDKIGLARNIISLHTEKDNLLSLEEGILGPTKSSYQIYLKKNVQQYIDVKNKISEFIFDISEKICETIDNFIGTFKKNLTAFITYSISLIISNSISGGKLKDIFTEEITVISFIIIGISLGFLIVSTKEVYARKKRLSDNYEKLRERYIDILEKNDLEKILDKGIDMKKESKFINTQLTKYIIFWAVSISFFLAVLFIFGNWPQMH